MPSTNIKNLNSIADLLDTRFKGPFGFRFGLDGLLGLIPGLGDIITNLMATYIILSATWQGYPSSVIMRMFMNLCVDNALDAIPLIGPLFDFVFKSNMRNIRLMEAYEANPQQVTKRSFYLNIFIISGIVLFTLAMVAVSLWATSKIALWLLTAIQ